MTPFEDYRQALCPDMCTLTRTCFLCEECVAILSMPASQRVHGFDISATCSYALAPVHLASWAAHH